MSKQRLLTGTLTGLLALTQVLGASTHTNGIPVEVSVDPRVELFSIIFRLAGNPEYCRGIMSTYVKDIDKYFEPFRNHDAIQLAQKLRNTRGISYDAPMNLAIHLNDITELKERIPLQPRPACLDRRWQPEELTEFLKLTRQFVKDTDFNVFYRMHCPLYDLAATRAQISLADAHLDWFGHFFGARPGASFKVIVAPNNMGNYGVRIGLEEGKEDLYCILCVYMCDASGDPSFNDSILGTVAHEFGHSYVNPLVFARADELQPAGQKLFGKVGDRMKRQAYGNWQTMMNESLVRAAVVRYLHTTQGNDVANQQVQKDIDCGFLWMDDLSRLLSQYEAQRDKYPTFNAFLSQIVDFFNTYSKQLEPTDKMKEGKSEPSLSPAM